MRFLIIVLFSFSSLLMSGCWFDQENERESITRGLSPKELYNLAEYELKSGNTEEAFNIYENVLAAYPASKYSSQAKLRIIYENYKAEKYDDAILATENYISENPNDSSTPYAYYMRALISEKLAKSILDDLVTDFAQRDITSIISAYNYYLLLIEKFPEAVPKSPDGVTVQYKVVPFATFVVVTLIAPEEPSFMEAGAVTL